MKATIHQFWMLCQQYSNRPKEKQISRTAKCSYKLYKLRWFVHSETGKSTGPSSSISENNNKSFKIGWLMQSILEWNVAGTIYLLALDVLHNPWLDKSKNTISSFVMQVVLYHLGRILQFYFGFSRYLIVPEWNMPNKQLSLTCSVLVG